jgi:hypothetical protein
MNNNYLGLIGYSILTIAIALTVPNNIINGTKEPLFYDIIQLIGYSNILITLYNEYNKEEEKGRKEEPNNSFEYGHIILFLFYFFEAFISEEPLYTVTLIGLYAHFLLIKENKIMILGFTLSLIYYIMKIMFYYKSPKLIIQTKVVSYIILAIFYYNNISNKVKNNDKIENIVKKN